MPPNAPRIALVAGLAAGALAVFAVFGSTDLVLFNDYLDHPFAFGVIACALVGGALWTWAKPTWARAVIGIVTVVPICGLLLLGMVMTSLSTGQDAGSIDGPGQLSIRIRSGTAGLGPDTMHVLTLRNESEPFTREWALGCFNDDVVGDGFDSASWVGDHMVELRTSDGRAFLVSLDPATGEPAITEEVGTC